MWIECKGMQRALRLLEAWLRYSQAAAEMLAARHWSITRAMVLTEMWERRREHGLRLAPCSECGERGVALAHELRYCCPVCSGSVQRGARRRGRSGRSRA